MAEEPDPPQDEPLRIPWWIRWYNYEGLRLASAILVGLPTAGLIFVLGWVNLSRDLGVAIALWLEAAVLVGFSIWVAIRARRWLYPPSD